MDYGICGDNYGITAAANYVYIAKAEKGVYILDSSQAPALLQAFSISTVSTGIKITWNTLDGFPISRFNIYRKPMPDGEFEIITPDGITASSTRKYEYTDRDVICGKTYQYRLTALKADGDEMVLTEKTIEVVMPEAVELYQNIPNPFNPSTTIRFITPERERVELSIYDLSGRLVVKLINNTLEKGEHKVVWRGLDAHGRPVSSGVYFYRLKVGKKVITRKMVLLR